MKKIDKNSKFIKQKDQDHIHKTFYKARDSATVAFSIYLVVFCCFVSPELNGVFEVHDQGDEKWFSHHRVPVKYLLCVMSVV